jgi:Tol biopolymer transport system component
VGFFANGKLWKVALAGRPKVFVCEAQKGRGGTWNSADTIVFAATETGSLRRVQADGTGEAEVTRASSGAHLFPQFLPDGRHFLYLRRGVGPMSGIYLGDLQSKPDAQSDQRLLTGDQAAQYDDRFGKVSRDGKWLAYGSNKSGRFQVYVRPFLTASGAQPVSAEEMEGRRISSEGGMHALWRADSKELFYVEPDTRKLMAVDSQRLMDASILAFQNPRFRYAVTRAPKR